MYRTYLRRNQFASLFVWAGGTFALALALGLPAVTNAVDDSNSPGLVAKIITPQITANGIDLSVNTENSSTQPSQHSSNEPLKLTVKAVNTIGAQASGDFEIQLFSVSPVATASRVMPAPTEIWKDSGSVVLDAGKDKTLTFTPSPVPDHKLLVVAITFGGQNVRMMTLAPQTSGQYAEAR